MEVVHMSQRTMPKRNYVNWVQTNFFYKCRIHESVLMRKKAQTLFSNANWTNQFIFFSHFISSSSFLWMQNTSICSCFCFPIWFFYVLFSLYFLFLLCSLFSSPFIYIPFLLKDMVNHEIHLMKILI